MTNQIHIPVDASLSAKLAAVSKRYNTDEQGLLLLAIENFLEKDETLTKELQEDEARFHDVVVKGNGIANSVVMKWIDDEIYSLRRELSPEIYSFEKGITQGRQGEVCKSAHKPKPDAGEALNQTSIK